MTLMSLYWCKCAVWTQKQCDVSVEWLLVFYFGTFLFNVSYILFLSCLIFLLCLNKHQIVLTDQFVRILCWNTYLERTNGILYMHCIWPGEPVLILLTSVDTFWTTWIYIYNFYFFVGGTKSCLISFHELNWCSQVKRWCFQY